MQYSDGNHPNEGIECRWGRQKSRFWANVWIHGVLSTLLPARCYQYDAVGPPSRKLWHLSLVVSGGVDSGKRRRNVHDKKPQRYAKDHRIIVTQRHSNNTRLMIIITITNVAAWFVKHSMPPLASNDAGTALDQDGSDKSRDLATLILGLWGHGACGWCGSSSSIRTLSLKFVALAVRKIWRTMWVSINGPDDPYLWPFDHESGVRVASKAENLRSECGHTMPAGSRVIRYVCDGRTDKLTHSLLRLTSWGS